MATVSNNNIARAIYLAVKDKHTTEQHTVIKNVVNFLFRRRMLSKSKNILQSLNNIVNHANGVVEVKIWSKYKLSHDHKDHLEKILKKRYGDKEFIFLEYLDDKLLGGFNMEVNNELIDLTIKNKIYKLQEHLKTEYE